jgi:transcriptional regulator with XRE-family HTH domain
MTRKGLQTFVNERKLLKTRHIKQPVVKEKKVRAGYMNELQTNETRNTEELGSKIKRLLRDNGWLQEFLAQRSGIKPSTLSRLLSGDRNWKFEYVSQIAGVFAISVEELTKGTMSEGVEGIERAPQIARDAVTLAQEALAEEQQENAALLAKQEALQKEVEDLRTDRALLQEERDLRPTREAWAVQLSEFSELSLQRTELQRRLRNTEDLLAAEKKKSSTVQEERDTFRKELTKEREKSQKLVREKLYLQSEKDAIQKRADEAYKLAAQYQQASAQLKKAKSTSDTIAVLAGLGLLGAALSK